jgi:hypothetical protein
MKISLFFEPLTLDIRRFLFKIHHLQLFHMGLSLGLDQRATRLG